MRPLPLLALAAVVSAAVAAGVSVLTSQAHAPSPGADARIERLQEEIDALRDQQPPRPARRHAPDGVPAPEGVPPSPVGAAPVGRGPARAASGPASADDTARTFLDRYLRSFDHDPKGSEFFRLAVEAFASELVSDIAAVVIDPDQPHAARAQLATFLGAPGLRGDATAIRALLDSLRTSPSDELASAAFAGLRTIGDRGTAVELEALAPFLELPRLRGSLYEAVAALAPDGANAALLRMLAQEKDERAQQALVRSLNTADPAAALDVIRQVSTGPSHSARNRAAEKLGTLRTPEARQFLDEWLARETRYSVRGRLTAARAEWDKVPKYSAERMVGPPDVENPAADHENAWCPKTQSGGREWILLSYAEPLVATHVRVHQVYKPGAVVAVEVEDEFGRWHLAWEGRDAQPAVGVLDVRLRALDRRVKRVRVILDTKLHGGWHEIDAVELVGPDGRAWATEAAASSTWGD